MKTKSSSLERRNFLNKLSSVVGGSAVLAAVPFVQAAPVSKPEPTPENKLETKGYQRTEHVDTYYHLADF